MAIGACGSWKKPSVTMCIGPQSSDSWSDVTHSFSSVANKHMDQ